MTLCLYPSKITISSIREFFSSFSLCILAWIHIPTFKNLICPKSLPAKHPTSRISNPPPLQKVDHLSSRFDGWLFLFPLLKRWGIHSMFAWNPVIRPLGWFGNLTDSFEGTETSSPQNISDISGFHFQVTYCFPNNITANIPWTNMPIFKLQKKTEKKKKKTFFQGKKKTCS